MEHELFGDKGNQSHDSGFFYRVRKGSLVPGTSPVPFGRIDLALGVHEPSYEIGILEVDLVHFALAKKTGLLFGLGYDVIFVIH